MPGMGNSAYNIIGYPSAPRSSALLEHTFCFVYMEVTTCSSIISTYFILKYITTLKGQGISKSSFWTPWSMKLEYSIFLFEIVTLINLRNSLYSFIFFLHSSVMETSMAYLYMRQLPETWYLISSLLALFYFFRVVSFSSRCSSLVR